MLVVQAKHKGMCFGVRDALTAMRNLPRPQDVTVHGELVHNPVITREMSQRGFHQQSESDRNLRLSTPEVLITAHGVSEKKKREFLQAGYTVHDTTCPLVRRAHKACLHYHNRGYFIVLVGKRGHVEVEGLAGDLDHFVVVSHLDEIRSYPVEKLAIVNQTTTRPDELAQFHERIAELNPKREIAFVDTTCQPTKDRQSALLELIAKVDALVVVGGANSNNTRQLGLRAEERGVPWWQVSSAEELRAEWFREVRIVGLSAGTSTTDETIAQVARALRAMKSQETKFEGHHRRSLSRLSTQIA